MKFNEQVVIITGGAGGIGLATGERFAAAGARVVLADLDPKKAETAAQQIQQRSGRDTLGVGCDVSREDQVIAAVAAVLHRFGRLDVIVNNAGLMTFKAIVDTSGDDWMRVFAVDVLGAFYFTKQAFLHMPNGGAIVNVSSVHAVETTPMVAPYAAAKAALLSLTRSGAIEGKARNIRVNAILPGAIDTPMLWNNPNVKSGVEVIDRSTVGRPEDVADVIVYLASDEARFVQGATVRVDGGRLSRLS